MQNKTKLLNILLAAVIVILVYQLSFIGDKVPSMEDNKMNFFSERIISDSIMKKSVGKKGYIMPKPALVIGSYNKDGKPNIMTASWAGICNSDPLSIAISVNPSRLTYDNIMATKSFTINVPSIKFVAEVDYAGNVGGRDDDKFKSLGLTPIKGEFVNAPYIEEFPVVIECEVSEIINLGSHTQFIGRVIDTKVDVNLIKENGGIDISAMQPVIYEGQNYYSFGVPVAKAGDAYKLFVDELNPSVMPTFYDNSVLSIIHERKSVRNFTAQKVSDKNIITLIKAGMAAPTAVNMQPWKFIAINDTTILNKLADVSTYGKMLHHAPAAIAVCGDLTKALADEYQELWIQDCSAASQNILLAAESMGLGAVWTSTYPNKELNKQAKEILNLPEHIIPLNIIAVGYPTGIDKKKDKGKEENIFWNEWSN